MRIFKTRGFLLAFAGFTGVILILISTPWGIGVSHDSVYYLDSAQNLLAGSGLQWQAGDGNLKPLTHYPPLYSIVLALAGLSGIEMVVIARILAAILFGANLVGIACLVDRYTQNRRVAWVALSLSLISPILLDVHLMALTEPLFMLFLLISVSVILEFLMNQCIRWLFLAGVLSALAVLTRYAGLSLVAAIVLALILLWKESRRRKILGIGLYLLVSLIPLLGWNIRNQMVAGTSVGRVIRFHLIPVTELKIGAKTLTQWVVPEEIPFWVGFGFLSIIIIGVGIVIQRKIASGGHTPGDWMENAQNKLGVVLILYVLVYGLFVIISLTFVDASTPLDVRISSPAYLTTFIAFFTILEGVEFGEHHRRLGRGLLFGLGVVIFLSYGYSSIKIINSMREEGLGFTSRKWLTSELIVKVNEMGEDAVIYSSDALRLSFLTGRTVYGIPQKLDPIQGIAIESYQDDITLMRERLKQSGAALVLFSDSFALYRPELPKIEEVTEGLVLSWNTRHGVIYIDPMSVEH